ncbi:hypothetical protein SAMD00019534_063380 [Acytostelium subglobosum LB1]|uniref:hypothetical protein n=1 Tax=Acytostelium subglobosum LB1 TaxID=1410327 RepID=UPI000644AAB6|nr:hypothetical protein SAMD00019534_063380 [Acytostelium subglobosum LB1]GAM23163.1 hypothetical protein SAMD00019534_063380 [Acytostelium subglobosum LB1]|eukprot:XP_012753612.1 hypothetical protein SAMD00019534_063380 [Acytostelium subglobosum LB1]
MNTPQSPSSVTNIDGAPAQPFRTPPPPPPPRRKSQKPMTSGNACMQQVGMGLLMGSLVGSSMGLLIGLAITLPSGIRGRKMFIIAGNSALKSTAFFAGLMGIGSALRCDDYTQDESSLFQTMKYNHLAINRSNHLYI